MAEIGKDMAITGLNGNGYALTQARLGEIKSGLSSSESQRASVAGVWTTGGKKTPGTADIEKSATQFEALLLQQMFKSMWESLPKEGMLSGSREEELFRDMLNETLAKEVSERQSIGIKAIVMKEMQRRLGQEGK